MRLTLDDFHGFMRNWDRRTRDLITERLQHRYFHEPLAHFSPDEAITLSAMLDRMIPQEGEERIDLVGFIDWALGKPLGRGDRQEQTPIETVLFHQGLLGVQETAQLMYNAPFAELPSEQQDRVLTALQSGQAEGATWTRIPARHFFTQLLMKALTGFCAHPATWMRMGFPGPSYPEGYLWVGPREVLARRRHFPGWRTF